jgi:hypothetical protein
LTFDNRLFLGKLTSYNVADQVSVQQQGEVVVEEGPKM